MSLEKLIKSAGKIQSQLENGKEFLARSVYSDMEKASIENPGDTMISMMRDYVQKRASKSDFINQKEIGETYNSLINYAGGEKSTQFRVKLAKYLPQGHQYRHEVNYADVSGIRGGEQKVKTLQEYDTGLQKMADQFAGVFSLNKEASFSVHSDLTSEKAKKFVDVQLSSLGCKPKGVVVVAQNEHFALCKAAFDTSSKREVSVEIPVQITSGMPRLPSQFVDNGNLVDLNKINILSHLKEKEELKKFDARQRFASERSTSVLSIDNVTAPKELSYLTDIEDKVATAASKFDNQQVSLARRVLSTELKSAGFNSQIKLAGFTDNQINFNANIGNSIIEIPVEFSSGRPLMPSSFSHDNKKYAFSSNNILKVAKANVSRLSDKTMSFTKESYDNMSYHQLMDEMIRGVSEKDYRTSEDALSAIQSKFDDTSVKHALSKYTSLLKTAGMNTEREDLIKAAVSRGDLIRVPTSVDLYSPKLGLPLSKLAFDENGGLIPVTRVLQRENQGESEVFGISSYQIKIN